MATGDITYVRGTETSITISPASLASDTNLLAGVESNSITPSSCLDHEISGKLTLGTSPTANRVVQIYVIPTWKSGTFPNVFDGTASAETATSANVLETCAKLLHVINSDSTSNQSYEFSGLSVRNACGGILPASYVIFITHNTGAATHATAGNHEMYYTPTYQNVAA